MKKTAIRFLFSLTLIPLVGCAMDGGTDNSSTSTDSSSEVTGNQNLNKVLDYFTNSVNVIATYSFFNAQKTPGSTTVYLNEGFYVTFRNFGDNVSNAGMINVDSALAAKKGIEEGVYGWTKEDSALKLGDKLGTGTYQSIYHNPTEIASSKTSYVHFLRHESESATKTLSDAEKGALSGNFTLNKLSPTAESKELLVSFAKSLGVYETIYSIEGMELNYANIYFGPITATLNVTFYTQYKGGYSAYETTLTLSQFGSAKIAELSTYIGGE